jgi:hypothetical protein
MLSLKMLTSCFNGAGGGGGGGGGGCELKCWYYTNIRGDKKRGAGGCCFKLELMTKIKRRQKKGAKNELKQGRHLTSLVKGKCVGVQRETCKCIPIFGNLNLQVSNKFGARVEELDLVKIKSFFN